ncbi:MAG: sensor histidine kinase [Planctomycetaceae bacterium]
MIRSLRWRLQAWHAVVLTVVLTTFGVIVYHLLWRTRLHQIDAELDRTAEVLTSRLRRLSALPQWRGWRPPMALPSSSSSGEIADPTERGHRVAEWGPTWMVEPESHSGSTPTLGDSAGSLSNTSRVRWLPEEFSHLFEGEDSQWYFVVWGRDGRVLLRSEIVPPVEFENLFVESNWLPVRIARSRAGQREVVHVASSGTHVLVGRSITWDVASQQAEGWLLAACGWAILTLGVVGGGWLSGRTLRPIATMSAIAKDISAENLSQRIDLHETDSEMGQLALVLNQTFDRLESAFEQQARFTADASHELRTPLSVILSQIELSLSRPRSSDEYLVALETCQRASRRMRLLIDSLLMLARFDSGQPDLNCQPMDLSEVVTESVELLRPLADERQITLGSNTSPVPFVGDRERLGQVVMNLLSNAIRYNHDGGRVDVRVERINGDVVVSVSDTGIGIPVSKLPHIFERFFRVDPARSRADGGSGLGLAICRSVVEAHGGQITARSELPGGTTLEVRLPVPGEHESPSPNS